MEALLIIDMQKGCFAVPRHDRAGTASRANHLAERFREAGKPVIFVQHDGTKENYLYPGTPDFEIIDELTQANTDYHVVKTLNSAFYRTNLGTLLDDLSVDTLTIAGLATDFCVNATIHSALLKNYHLRITSDAHTTAARAGLSAETIIAYHNWLWANLSVDTGSIAVLSTEDIVNTLESRS